MKRSVIVFAAILALALPRYAAAAIWNIDRDHSSIGFQISKLLVTSVKGSFARYSATLDLDDEDLARSQVSVTIEPASIDTGNAKRDEHLRSPDYFDIARYPVMTFVSKRIVKADGEHYQLVGDLTIRDVTRELTLAVTSLSAPAKDTAGYLRRRATATATVNRKDYGLAWNAFMEGVMAVGNEVIIVIDVAMVKAQGP